MKILLATDGSECSELAVEEVARKKWPPGSSVRVVSVIELNAVVAAVPEACTPAQEFCEEAGWEAREAAERAAAKLRRAAKSPLAVESYVCAGYPCEVIIEEAEAWGADLIVVGSHGRGFTGRLLHGSTSHEIATRANCEVRVVTRRD
ncbi:MAG: universal stress protein [Pyrinomonadaceae bacterium]